MQVQNPESKDKNEMVNEIETKEEKTEDKAAELAFKLHEGEITYADINDEALEKEIHERFIIQEEEIPEPDDDKQTGVEGTAETNKDEPANEIQKKPEQTEEEKTFLQQRKEELDELNRIQQKADAAAKRLEELGKLPAIPEKKKFDDVLSEEAIQSVMDRQDKLESRQKVTLETEKENLQTELRDIKNEKLFMEITNFQGQSSLKTSKPIKVLNAQWKKFVGDIGGPDNVDKFLSDNVYKEQMEAKGLNFPMSDDDYKNFDQISKINTFKRDGKYPSITSAFHDYQIENGIVLDQVKNAAIKAAQDTLEKIGVDGSATTLSPDDGSVESTNSEMTTKFMETWLVSHPNPSTPEELKMAETIHNQIRDAQRG